MRSMTITAFLVLFTSMAFSQRKIQECVIEGGVLKIIEVDYNPANGDRSITVNGVKKNFYDVYPIDGKEYATKMQWYINNDPVTFLGKKYVKYGLPRILETTDVIAVAKIGTVSVFIETGKKAENAEVIYIPSRSGCEFQPYQRLLDPCGTVTLKADKVEVKQGETVSFTASFKGEKGELDYKWNAGAGTIIGDNKSSTLKVSTKDVSGELTVSVDVRSIGKRCEAVFQYKVIQVKKK